jgi:murein DD-endopeptidase MepM/ murein hydrolase activator NlpD
MGVPGVGAVVDEAYDGSLGLVPDNALLLSTPKTDPVLAAAEIQEELGNGVAAVSLTIPVSDTGRLTWVAPCYGPITQGFGPDLSPITGKPQFHPGIDIGAPLGSPIYAASSGYVLYAGPASGFGQEIILQHPGNVETVYGHMERILVTSGPVTVGQPIALVGDEGESTGPHLHFEVHVNGQLVNPLTWLEDHGVSIDS